MLQHLLLTHIVRNVHNKAYNNSHLSDILSQYFRFVSTFSLCFPSLSYAYILYNSDVCYTAHVYYSSSSWFIRFRFFVVFVE